MEIPIKIQWIYLLKWFQFLLTFQGIWGFQRFHRMYGKFRTISIYRLIGFRLVFSYKKWFATRVDQTFFSSNFMNIQAVFDNTRFHLIEFHPSLTIIQPQLKQPKDPYKNVHIFWLLVMDRLLQRPFLQLD